MKSTIGYTIVAIIVTLLTGYFATPIADGIKATMNSAARTLRPRNQE